MQRSRVRLPSAPLHDARWPTGSASVFFFDAECEIPSPCRRCRLSRRRRRGLLILIADASLEKTACTSETLRVAIADSAIAEHAVTFRFGVTASSAGAAEPAELLDQANKSPHFSKRNGRNRVTKFIDLPADSLVSDMRAVESPAMVLDSVPSAHRPVVGLPRCVRRGNCCSRVAPTAFNSRSGSPMAGILRAAIPAGRPTPDDFATPAIRAARRHES